MNKIFEVSDVCPIGLMIFNKLDCMDLPLEILSKEYRRQHGKNAFPTVRAFSEDFLRFLSEEVTFDETQEEQNHTLIVSDALSIIHSMFPDLWIEDIKETGKVLKSRFNGLLKEAIDAQILKLEQMDFADGFKRGSLDIKIKEISNKIARDKFRLLQITKANEKLLHKYIGLYLSKNILSSYKTRLIFAGYGNEDICQSLVYIEIDGIIQKKIKLVKKEDVDIGRHGPSAEVLGFAQDDMVQSFMNGVNPAYRAYSSQILRSAIEEAGKLVLRPILRDDDKIIKLLNGLSNEFDQLSKLLGDRSDQFIDRNFTQDVKSMVKSMPKQELANLAESLIEITSLKRKVTRDRETVGGDVDVAVISRAEGLVWVKRKHYFPATLNARFFARRSEQWREA